MVLLLILLGTTHATIMAQGTRISPSNIVSLHDENSEGASSFLLKQLIDDNVLFPKSRSRWHPSSKKTTVIVGRKVKEIKCLVAYYSNLGVVTFLNGPQCMKQYIFTKTRGPTPVCVDSSWVFTKKKGTVTHRYKWGKVVSYTSKKQEIKAKKRR